MYYTLLIYENQASFDLRHAQDAKKSDTYWAGWSAYTKALQEAGVMVGGAGLQAPDVATTLRLGEKRHVQDDPYSDTKEQLGGSTSSTSPT
jgi:hypothetical protein